MMLYKRSQTKWSRVYVSIKARGRRGKWFHRGFTVIGSPFDKVYKYLRDCAEDGPE